MLDQSNWPDASFKTYSTPLALTFPVEVPAGSRIRQAVTLKMVGSRPIGIRSQPEVIDLQFPSLPTCRLPRLGLGSASDGQPLSDTEIQTLRSLRLAHVRVDVRLADAGAVDNLRRATRDAARLGARLELALYLPREDEASPHAILE